MKLILPNSAHPGQESQKWFENSATDLVTSRLREVTKSDREVTKSDREVTKSDREVTKSDREVTKALVFCARWPSPWHYFRDIFGSPGQEEPSWAKWVSPSISSMKTTTFKPNLYFCHRIPLSITFEIMISKVYHNDTSWLDYHSYLVWPWQVTPNSWHILTNML